MMFSFQDVIQKEERINLQLNNPLNKDSHPNHSNKSWPSSSCRLDKIPPNAKYEREKKSIDVHNLAIRVVRTVSRVHRNSKSVLVSPCRFTSSDESSSTFILNDSLRVCFDAICALKLFPRTAIRRHMPSLWGEAFPGFRCS